MKGEFVYSIGVWGQRHYNYIKKNSPTVINVMRMNGTLEQYLKDISRDAREMFEMLIRQYSELDNITEELKAENQMLWVQMMNNIKFSAEEIVLNEIIYR